MYCLTHYLFPMQNLDRFWPDETFIAFDTETTGKYPLESEICEIAAVKWQNGQIIDEYQQLIKPSQQMGQEVINIHNITNEMVEHSPSISEVLTDFAKFIGDGYLVAHHAPFDLGFLAIEFEKYNLDFPKRPVFCSSLLSRKIISSSPNHRLQTLIKYLNIPEGQAHRALDDSKACLAVTLKCFEKVGEKASLDELFTKQGKKLEWADYSIGKIQAEQKWQALVKAIQNQEMLHITYQGGRDLVKNERSGPKGLLGGLMAIF